MKECAISQIPFDIRAWLPEPTILNQKEQYERDKLVDYDRA